MRKFLKSLPVIVAFGACAALSVTSAPAGTLKTLYSFCSQAGCSDGSAPSSTLLAGPAGNLFGATDSGGSHSFGTIFELVPQLDGSWTHDILYNFCPAAQCADGAFPGGRLIRDAGGNLYGVATSGGAASWGVVFELSPGGSSWTYSVLHSFAGTDGGVPSGGLTYAGFDDGQSYDGTSPLYGVTGQNGLALAGTAYQMTLSGGSWSLAPIYDFSSAGSPGQNPWAPLMMDDAGHLYGTLLHNYGAVFELANSGGSWSISTLHAFSPTGGDHTYYPLSGLLQNSSGTLFGSVSFDGPYCTYKRHYGYKRCGGAIYKLSARHGADWKYVSLYDFCASGKHCTDGSGPVGQMVMDETGNLYGVTSSGGANGKGTVFRVTPGGRISVLYSFCSLANCGDGAAPIGLTRLGTGQLVGMTQQGGTGAHGTVFEFIP